MIYNKYIPFESDMPEVLQKEELNELFIRKEKGDLQARNEIIKHNLRLVVYHITNKFGYMEHILEDLISIGNIGLIKAVDTFDLSKGFQFSPYACKCMNNEIIMFLRKQGYNNIDSLDRVIAENKHGTQIFLSDTLIAETNIVEDNEYKETRCIIRKLVQNLPERNREIVMLYFGFYGKKYSQKEIAEKLNLSQSYISKQIPKILNIIENQLYKQNVFEFNEKMVKNEKNMKLKKTV